MNFKLMMTLRSKYNQGLRTKETLEANRMYLKLRLNSLLKEAKVNSLPHARGGVSIQVFFLYSKVSLPHARGGVSIY